MKLSLLLLAGASATEGTCPAGLQPSGSEFQVGNTLAFNSFNNEFTGDNADETVTAAWNEWEVVDSYLSCQKWNDAYGQYGYVFDETMRTFSQYGTLCCARRYGRTRLCYIGLHPETQTIHGNRWKVATKKTGTCKIENRNGDNEWHVSNTDDNHADNYPSGGTGNLFSGTWVGDHFEGHELTGSILTSFNNDNDYCGIRTKHAFSAPANSRCKAVLDVKDQGNKEASGDYVCLSVEDTSGNFVEGTESCIRGGNGHSQTLESGWFAVTAAQSFHGKVQAKTDEGNEHYYTDDFKLVCQACTSPCDDGSHTCDTRLRDQKDLDASCQQELFTFTDFSTGTFTGCEQHDSELKEQTGSDCVWTSARQGITHPHAFENIYVHSKVKTSSNLDNSAQVKIEVRACTSGAACGGWTEAVVKNDNLPQSDWAWVTQTAARAVITSEEDQVQLRVTLKNNGGDFSHSTVSGYSRGAYSHTDWKHQLTSDNSFVCNGYHWQWNWWYGTNWCWGDHHHVQTNYQNHYKVETSKVEQIQVHGGHSHGDCDNAAQTHSRGVCLKNANAPNGFYTCNCVNPSEGTYFPAVDHQMSYILDSNNQCEMSAPIQEVAVSVPGFSTAAPSEEETANMLANQPAPNVPETAAPTPAPTAGEDEKIILEEIEVEVVKATFAIPITCLEVAGASVAARAMQGAAEAGVVAASGVSAENTVLMCETSRRLTESSSSADVWNAEISVPDGAATVSENLRKSGENGVLMNTIKATAKESGVLTQELAAANPIVAVDR